MTLEQTAILYFCALVLGISKTGLLGASILTVPLLALAFGARESIGLVLPLLLVGDCFAVAWFRRHADWSLLARLAPMVIPGMAIGFIALAWTDNAALQPLIGLVIVVMLIISASDLRSKITERKKDPSPIFRGAIGAISGFATTIANAAGPIMSLYLILSKLPKRETIGTAAWFFLLINLAKLPIYVPLGIITRESLYWNLLAAPAVFVGALIGKRILDIIPETTFRWTIWLLSFAAAIKLLIP